MRGSFTNRELVELESAIREFGEQRRAAFNLEEYFNKWNRLVDETQKGYRLGIYDYANDLSSRDVLERFKQSLSGELQDKFAFAIAPLDDSFRKATNETDVPLAGGPISNAKLPWWWHRIPKKLLDELNEDYLSFKENRPRNA